MLAALAGAIAALADILPCLAGVRRGALAAMEAHLHPCLPGVLVAVSGIGVASLLAEACMFHEVSNSHLHVALMADQICVGCQLLLGWSAGWPCLLLHVGVSARQGSLHVEAMACQAGQWAGVLLANSPNLPGQLQRVLFSQVCSRDHVSPSSGPWRVHMHGSIGSIYFRSVEIDYSMLLCLTM